MHPEWLERQRLPPGERGERFWQERYEDINAFERHLDRNGTKIVNFFLHVSKDVQKERFLARLDRPGKESKFNAADLAERTRFDDYFGAFEDALSATSTPWAPWYVLPADHWWVTQALACGCWWRSCDRWTSAGRRSRPRTMPPTWRPARR